MLRTITAITGEIDDEELAASQILEQITASGDLLKNTIGIVACHYEFVLSGAFKAVCSALPFNVVGTISSIQSVTAETGSLLLTVMVLTSDDVEFDMVVTPSLIPEPDAVIRECYRTAKREQSPALILTFAPYLLENCGDDYVNALTEISGGVPCFGTIAVDDTATFINCFLLAEGAPHRDRMGMILIYGNINPRFYIANISEKRMLERSALITKSTGPLLMEVNERPVSEFLEDLGLLQAAETRYSMASLPLLLDYNDGTPKVSKLFVSLTPEKYAVCAGAMPQGSTMYLTMTNKDDILLTTNETMEQLVNDLDTASGLLIYSCVSRSMALAADQYREIALVKAKIGSRIPYMMANSGGEICPTLISDSKAINRFHNNAFIACLF